MTHKDTDRRNRASKERMRRYRERKGVTHRPEPVTPSVTNVTPDVTPKPGTLSRQEIAVYVKGLTARQAQAMLDAWVDNGSVYQQRLAKLGRAGIWHQQDLALTGQAYTPPRGEGRGETGG